MLDIDGCLADFCYGYSSLAVLEHEMPGPPHTNGGQRTWNWDETAGHRTPGYPEEVVNAIWRQIKASPTFWGSLHPLVTTQEMDELTALVRDHDLEAVYVTARPGETALQQTTRWLRVVGLPLGTVLIRSDKAQAAFDLEEEGRTIVAVLEDKPDTIHELHSFGFNVYCRDWAYNRGLIPGYPASRRVASLGEFVANVRAELERENG